MEGVSTVQERVEWLTTTYDLSENNAKALLLAEIGYSHSGIAKRLDVTESTAKKYLDTLEEKIGKHVTETLPKSVRYPTFPGDTPKDEVRYSPDYVDVSPKRDKRDLPLNKGCDLEDIPTDLITIRT